MATFKAIVRSVKRDGFIPVFIRVTQNRQIGYIKTDKMVSRKNLSTSGEILDPYVASYCSELILDYNDRLNRKDAGTWSVREIVRFLEEGDEELCFSDYARIYKDRMMDNGQLRNAKNYEMAYNHFERFAGSTKIMFCQMTSANINKWIDSLSNTRRAKELYPVCIRQIFRAAVKEYNDYDAGIVRIKTNPWGKVKIPQADKSNKIAISPEECRKFFSAPLPDSKQIEPLSELGKDVAMLVLCLAGINTIDLYNLKKRDLRGNRICYERAKTRKSRNDDAYIEMRIEPIIESLIKKYQAEENDPFLFRFHKRYSSSDSFNANVNNGIKAICEKMGIPPEERYCVYTFRHTWGTVAQNDCGASISEVGFAMNHSHGSSVTRGYIKTDFSPAWELNSKVIDFIFFSNKKSKQSEAKDLNVKTAEEKGFRLSPKAMIYARAYFRGDILAEVTDIGFSNVDEVIASLVDKLPDTIPEKCAVHFRIKNVDDGREAVYERTKGKGF